MSDVISHDDRDALAAEYVLGTLDYAERIGATNLLEVDHGFRGIVRIWERRLGELHLMVEPVEPDPKVWERIKDKIPALAAATTPDSEQAHDKPETKVDAGATTSAAEPAAAASDAPSGTEPAAGAETPASTEAPPVTAEAAPPTAPEAEPAAGVALAPDAAANLMRELEEAAKMVPEASGEPATVPPPPLIQRDEPVAADTERRETPRPVRRWRLLALFMSLIAMALAALIGAWRFFPEQLPPQLQASTVLHIPVAEPAPPPPLPKARPTPPPTFDE